ncbi:MAG: hypothetical protein QG620_622 [Patescibacteria group bacterium]|nr:hypothetical protein [Patescibacteria group bacterium]
MCDCNVISGGVGIEELPKESGRLGKPSPYGVTLCRGNRICFCILSFENDRNATSFHLAPHHTAAEVAAALRKAADEIEQKDSGQKPLSPKGSGAFHYS